MSSLSQSRPGQWINVLYWHERNQWVSAISEQWALYKTFKNFSIEFSFITWEGISSWEPVEYVAPWLPGVRVCSAEGCLNRLTSYSPSDLLLLALFAVEKKKKNLCLSCSVIPSPNLPGLQVTWRGEVLHCGRHPHGALCMKWTVYFCFKTTCSHTASNFSNTQLARRVNALFTHSQENCSNTLTFPRAVGSCWSLHMCTHMSACWTLPVLFSPHFVFSI